MPGWDNWKNLLQEGFKQAREEGRETTAIHELESQMDSALEAGQHGDLGPIEALLAAQVELPMRADFPFQEPNDLSAIRALRPKGVRRFETQWSDDELLDKLHGAWLGRCAGCALGKPVEGFMAARGALKSWQRQKTYLTAISRDEWPLNDYFPNCSPAEEETGKVWASMSVRERIAYMESDDDIRYTVVGQKILMGQGGDFTSWDVAMAWMSLLPYKQVCTAETQAYRNLVWRYGFHMAPDAADVIDWEWVASFQNPYREWIGAQIRVDSYGYAAPGHPELAAEMAWRDARISHVKNGIYGAMFCAAMIAAAFATSNPHEIVAAGLAEIPTTSRLYAELRHTIEICEKYHCEFEHFESVLAEIYKLLDHYHPVHTNNNAALCVMAVLLSGGDFGRGIALAVMGGLDTDCNGATVGSIVGAITGARRAPGHWVARLNDTLNSEIIGYHPIAISQCAQRAFDIARNVQKSLSIRE